MREMFFVIIALLFLPCLLLGEDSFAFSVKEDSFTKDAILDLRELNEKESGETGFIGLSDDGNSFVNGNGESIRFWGVVSDVYRKSAEEIETHCRFLAKRGVNMIRLHANIASLEEGSKITDVNEKEIDGIMRFVAAAKSNGIYVTISPFWGHMKMPESWSLEGYKKNDMLLGPLFFNEKFKLAYKVWVKELFTRKNPYTGVALKDEAAVGIIQVKNEDSLLFWTSQKLPKPQNDILRKRYGEYLLKKYGSYEKALKEWDGVKINDDDFENGMPGMYVIWHMTQSYTGGMHKRVSDQLEFMVRLQYDFYKEMTDYYKKELGCSQLVNAMNWKSADPVLLDDSERYTYTATDIVALNRYTGVVHEGNNNGYRIDPGHKYISKSVLLNPLNLPAAVKQVEGHPFIITETAWVHPALYQSEGPFLMAVYQSLNGVDCTYWFASTDSTWMLDPRRMWWKVGQSYALHKWTGSVPQQVGQFPAYALAFRKAYIKEAENPVVYEERALDDLWQRKVPIISESAKYDPNRDEGLFAEDSSIKQSLNPLAFLVGPVVVKYDGNAANSRVEDISKYMDESKKTVKSVTKEIELNYGIGVCLVNTEKFQGVSGFLKKAGGHFPLSTILIETQNEYATISAVSMDGKSLEVSEKILVQIGTTVRLQGWQEKDSSIKNGNTMLDAKEIVNTGKPPWMIEKSHFALSIKNQTLTKAVVLDNEGYKRSEVKLNKNKDRMWFNCPEDAIYIVLMK